jgi:hypothetical protein
VLPVAAPNSAAMKKPAERVPPLSRFRDLLPSRHGRAARQRASGFIAPESSFNLHHRVALSSAPGEASTQAYPPATFPANTTPTTTLVTAEPRCSAVAHLAPRPEASRTRPASESDTASIPTIVPHANAAK